MRKIKFANNEYYHIYNRGVDKRNIFMNNSEFIKFIYKIGDHNNIARHSVSGRTPSVQNNIQKLVNIICYSLIPNHYHFILEQLVEGGISKFMHKLEMGYAKYFNHQHDRTEALFEGEFKAKHIDTNEYLFWLSGYVNGNSGIHKIAKAENWIWSSYQDYLGLRNGTLCNKEIILSQLADTDTQYPIGHRVSGEIAKQYRKYVEMVIKESSERKEEIKKYLME